MSDRPLHCRHVLWPKCACSHPPAVAWDLINKVNVKPAPERRGRGRPKARNPVEDAHEDFLSRLPLIIEEPALRDRLDKMLLAEECRRSLSKFCREAWAIIEPATKLEWNWHHELLCSVLQGIFEEWEQKRDNRKYKMRIRNVLFNVPPGTGKSRLLSCFFPTWVWLRAPGAKFLCLSVNEDASYRDARDSKQLMAHDWFQDTFQPNWQLRDDQEAVSNFGNTIGGVRISKGLSAQIIGLRADILLVDDANDPTDVESKVKREKINDLWKDTLYNRVNHPETSIRIGIQQRTHEEDWSGFVLKQQGLWSETNPIGWLHVCLPAEFDPDRRCVTPWGSDPRQVKGEPLHWSRACEVKQLIKRSVSNVTPTMLNEVVVYGEGDEMAGRLSPEFLDKEKIRLGSNKYSGLMQQRPTSAEGGTVKLAWWRFFQYDEHPLIPERGKRGPEGTDTKYPTIVVGKKGTWVRTWDFDWTVISVDAAAKRTERGSQHGILVVSGKGIQRFVRDDKTCRGDIVDVLKILRKLCAQYDPDKILIEDKAMGSDLATMFRTEFQAGKVVGSNGKPLMVRVDEVNPGSAGKEARLDSCLPEIEAGVVHVPEGATWVDAFLGEVCSFPLAANEDRVDALSMALNHMRQHSAYVLPKW